MSQLTTQQQVGARRVPDQARHMIDKIFENLTASCPILLTISKDQLEILKQQWILGFAENGIKTFEQVKRGMAAVRAKANGYLPSVGGVCGVVQRY
nr:MAG TPA: replication protein P [Bacteriophage sp.]